MQKIHQLIQQYKEDAMHFDDFSDEVINETLFKLDESLNSLNETNISSYIKAINEFKNSLSIDEEKQILTDFMKYCKYYNK
jgi:hypothetical protein